MTRYGCASCLIRLIWVRNAAEGDSGVDDSECEIIYSVYDSARLHIARLLIFEGKRKVSKEVLFLDKLE